MKSLLIFLAALAAAFATPQLVNEWPSWPAEEQLNLEPFEGTVQYHQPGRYQNIFQNGTIYLFIGYNNKFLSSINHGGPGGENYLQSIKLQQDQFCRFAASVLDDETIALRDFAGDGKYLQYNPSPEGKPNIRPTGEVIDDSTKFKVEVSQNGPWEGAHYVYLRASNGNYCGIVPTPVQDNIAAHFRRNINSNTRFIVLEAN